MKILLVEAQHVPQSQFLSPVSSFSSPANSTFPANFFFFGESTTSPMNFHVFLTTPNSLSFSRPLLVVLPLSLIFFPQICQENVLIYAQKSLSSLAGCLSGHPPEVIKTVKVAIQNDTKFSFYFSFSEANRCNA